MASQPINLRKATASSGHSSYSSCSSGSGGGQFLDKKKGQNSISKVKPLSCYSCFAVHRAIKLISPEILSISMQRHGSLLLRVKNRAIADKFLETKELLGVCAISCELPVAMNHVQGTIYAPYLINVPDAEIVAELGAQHVKTVYKYSTSLHGVLRYTGRILLTFELHTLPCSINIAWNSVAITPYIPPPMRCKNCQLLGHTAKHCSKRSACDICNFPLHAPQECIRVQCANCRQGHPSSSAACSKFREARAALKIKIRKRCSMHEARQIRRRQLMLANSARASTCSPMENIFFGTYSGQSSASLPRLNTLNSSPSYTPNSSTSLSGDSRNSSPIPRSHASCHLSSIISDDGMRQTYI